MNKNKLTSEAKATTEWDLSVFYKNENDPKIEKELKAIEKSYSAFEKKYKNKNYTQNLNTLYSALTDYIKLCEDSGKSHASRYFYFRSDLNSEDEIARANATKIGNRMTLAGNKIAFFTINISKIPKDKQKSFLKNEKLKPYQYFLKNIFDSAKYVLTEKEEQVIDLLSNTSYSMWIDGQDKLKSSQVVEFKGKKLPIQEAMSLISELPKDERRELNDKINEVLKSISHFAESEINAIYNFKKVMDERRGFKKPYSSTLIGYQNEEKDIEQLVDLVTKGFSISKRFYRLHAKLHKLDKLSVADRAVKIGEINKKFTFEESVKIVGDIFSKIGKKYEDIFYKLVENSQVDVYPKKGKTGGAYCASGYNSPTFILLNHIDNLYSLETLAHEMGHAIHSELSKSQPMIYQDYTMSSAEVASTFFEQVVLNEIETHLTEKEKIILLHNRLMGDISTIFRQIACFNFELDLHKKIRSEGQISKDDIAKLLKKHLESYMGEIFDIKDDDGYFFVSWGHIRRFFYVYTYAYGQIISKSFFENWKKNPKFIEKIDKFLSAGGSKSPRDIFKDAGINIKDPKFFSDGLRSIEKDIDKLEMLISKTKQK